MTIGIFEVPGIGGIKKQGFSKIRFDILEKYSDFKLVSKESHWEYLNQEKSMIAFKRRFEKKPKFNVSKKTAYMIRKFIYSSLSDVVAYKVNYHLEMIAQMESDLLELSLVCEKILIVGHSMGASMAHDLAVKHIGNKKIIGLVTTGCPTPYFEYDEIKDPKVPWLNIWEYDDFVSNPIDMHFCQDYEWKSKGLFSHFNLSVHRKYDNSKKLAKLISKKFLKGE